jgi:hypothetical protein
MIIVTSDKFNVLWTVHRDIFAQKNQQYALFYSQFILVINLYMFRAGLLLIIRRYFSVCVYVGWLLAGPGWILPTASRHKRMTYTNCCIYRVVPPDGDGFDGLVVSMLASGSRIRGFDPDRSRWIFNDVKKSSACLPS